MNNNINIAQSQPKTFSPSPGYIMGRIFPGGKYRNSDYEFKDFKDYQNNLPGPLVPASSESTWFGYDGAWLKEDREECSVRWQNAVKTIIKNQLTDRIKPFTEVLHFYFTVQLLIDRQFPILKHDIRWIPGATYLIKTLSTSLAVARGLYNHNESEINNLDDFVNWYVANHPAFKLTQQDFWDTQELLGLLNKKICDYAIKDPFYDLFEGQYSSESYVRKDENAFEFDRDFVLKEQRDTAYPVYNNAKANALEWVHLLFNPPSVLGEVKNLVMLIPVFPDKHYDKNNSANLETNKDIYPSTIPKWTMENYKDENNDGNYMLPYSKNKKTFSKYGQEARFQVPLLMLYPGTYDEQDNIDSSYIENDDYLKNAPIVKKLDSDVRYDQPWPIRLEYKQAKEAVFESFRNNMVTYLKK